MDGWIWGAGATSERNGAYPGGDRRNLRGGRRRGSILILDSNALSAFIDGDAVVGELLRHQARACIPVIVLGEFRYGIAKSRHRATYEQWLKSHLGQFDVLAVTQETAISYAMLRIGLKERGTPIPANDAWIAALAMQHNLPVLSRDRHFDAVSQLRRHGW